MNRVAKRLSGPILAAAAVALIIASLGRSATSLDAWYYRLRMPSWKPPDWLFTPAWTAIFALTALAAAGAWVGSRGNGTLRSRVLRSFALNSCLGILWSVLFFQFRRPDWALVEVAFLWSSIILMMIAVAPASRWGSWLLTPYLGWVTFAASLNLAIVDLNSPFAGG